MRHKRNKKEIKQNERSHYAGLAGKKPNADAAKHFIHKAYEPFIYGQEPVRKTVLQYLMEKYDLEAEKNHETVD